MPNVPTKKINPMINNVVAMISNRSLLRFDENLERT